MSPLGSEWIQSSHERYVCRREHFVPANFKATGSQFFWDGILHDRGWVPGCELCLVLTVLLEEIGIDFGLAPVVGGGLRSNGRPHPYSRGCPPWGFGAHGYSP